MPTTLNGLVVKTQSGFCTVHTEQGLFVCRLRGRLKKTRQEADIVAVGDHVTISPRADRTGAIETVATRDRVLQRRAPTGYDRRRADQAAQIIIANPDQAIFVFACADPAPHLRMLDRFLVSAESAGIPPIICANKVDLVGEAAARELFGLYERLGYPVIYTCALTGAGVSRLRAELGRKISVLAGPSGVGKSSILNAVQPGLGLAVRAVSQATAKGRHTTVVRELIPLDTGGWVADTPGLRAIALWDVEPAEVDGYFVEIKPRVAECEFSDCTHLHEHGCAVRAAVERGEIAPSRYESYRRMRAGLEDGEPRGQVPLAKSSQTRYNPPHLGRLAQSARARR